MIPKIMINCHQEKEVTLKTVLNKLKNQLVIQELISLIKPKRLQISINQKPLVKSLYKDQKKEELVQFHLEKRLYYKVTDKVAKMLNL